MKLKPVEAESVIKALAKMGFQSVRQRGSHLIMKHPDGRSTVVPRASWRGARSCILMEIMNDVGISKKEFLELLES